MFPLYFHVYISMSASLYHYHLSLHPFGSLSVFLSVVFSFNFSCNFLHFLNLCPISWILPLTLLLFQLGERWGELFIHCFISDNQCDHSHSQASCISNSSLVKEDRNPPSTFFPELLWQGYSGVATAMLVVVIVETSYLSGTLYPSLPLSTRYHIWRVWIIIFHHYTKGETERDHTWLHGLPKVTEENLYSNLCICHGLCIKFL